MLFESHKALEAFTLDPAEAVQNFIWRPAHWRQFRKNTKQDFVFIFYIGPNSVVGNSRLSLYTKYALMEHAALHSVRRALILTRKLTVMIQLVQ